MSNVLVSHPKSVKLDLTDLNIIMNLLELQIDLHFKPLSSVDKLQVSSSSRLNQLLLSTKEASRSAYAYSGMTTEPVELQASEVNLFVQMINACIDLREHLGLKNDTLINLKKRLGVDLYE